MMGAQYKLLSLLAIIGYVACDENADDLFEAPLGQGQLIFTHIVCTHKSTAFIPVNFQFRLHLFSPYHYRFSGMVIERSSIPIQMIHGKTGNIGLKDMVS